MISRLPHLAVFAALLLLAWVLAHWTWAFLEPRQPEPVGRSAAPISGMVLAEKAVALHLFGGGVDLQPGAPMTTLAAPANIQVTGLYAGRDGRSGFAVLVLDGKPISALAGQEFAPGKVLHRVLPDSVEIDQGGQLVIVRIASAPISAPGSAGKGLGRQQGEAPVLQLAVQQLGPGQYGFSRKELTALLKRPEQFPLLGRFGPHPRGGALLEQSPASGLPDRLGLKVGDVITAINGKLLSGPSEVARLYEQLMNSDRVRVDVLRAGKKMDFGIQVAP